MASGRPDEAFHRLGVMFGVSQLGWYFSPVPPEVFVCMCKWVFHHLCYSTEYLVSKVLKYLGTRQRQQQRQQVTGYGLRERASQMGKRQDIPPSDDTLRHVVYIP